jgi:hypothetical protein
MKPFWPKFINLVKINFAIMSTWFLEFKSKLIIHDTYICTMINYDSCFLVRQCPEIEVKICQKSFRAK